MKKSLLIILLAAGMQQAMAQAQRKVLVEEFTGAWCGSCPGEISDLDSTLIKYPTKVIEVANHWDDAMQSDYALGLYNAYQPPGFPQGMTDRADWSAQVYGQSPNIPPMYYLYSNFNVSRDATARRLNVSSPVSIDIASSYNTSTRSASTTVTANFVAAASGDMRITCLLVEDTIMGYDQQNYTGSACSDPQPSCEFYNYPCTISTSMTGQVFYYKHVARYNMAGDANYWGTTGVIPSSVSAGQHYSQAYSYTLPADWNAANMKVVAFISYYNSSKSWGGEVLNAQQVTLGQVTAVHEYSSSMDNVSLNAAYPNPFSDMTSIGFNIQATQHVSVKVYDMLGHEVAILTDENLSQGEHTLYWDGNDKDGSSLANGLYLIRLQTENQSLSKTVVLSRN